MTGLNLFQHLCNLARLATSALDNASSCEVSRHTHTLLRLQQQSLTLVIHYSGN